MTALITDVLLRNADLNIQVAVASCFSEVTRITAPTFPYPDDQMKEIFQLFMVAFEQLSTESGINVVRAQHILGHLANVRSCMIMLEIEVEAMIAEMFQLFLNTIRSNHSSDIFNHMETIMIIIIEESDEVPLELLRPLLDSVRKDNKEISPISWQLGKNVFEKCSTKLQPYLREAVKALNLKVDDYAEIVTSLCQDTSSGKNMIVEPPLALEKEETPNESNVEYGEEMVNARIMVWWPLDKTFYTGTVEAFDPSTKKHKIKYDDDEEEVLDLREERWELFNERPQQIQSSQKQEADHPSPSKKPVKSPKKIVRRKACSSKKQQAVSSSKRSKEGRL